MIILNILAPILAVSAGFILLLMVGSVIFYLSFYKKVPQGQALVRTGRGGIRVAFDEGMLVIPVLHLGEVMDTSLKKLEIARIGKDGLICNDNLRADIKVVFFVRVNQKEEDVRRVAQSIGCTRASSNETLVNLFDAKFSEALKTVGKQFNFVDLYNSREKFKNEILNTIGRDLNGYILDDCAIDYLEQTPLEYLKPDNILDAQGIKKITELTANEKIKANLIRRDEEKTIKKQNVEAQEAILELDRQLAEKQAIQHREIATIKAREEAETEKITQEERLKSERARITTEEEMQIAEENKQRQVIVAQKNKERTEVVETERVEKDRSLEQTEREKVVALASIEKEKAVEEEKRNIQEVIRERVVVERGVVEEEEKIKDTRAVAEADRSKTVALTVASQKAEEIMVRTVKAAEAEKEAAKIAAERKVIEAQAKKDAAGREADAKIILAEATAAEEAAIGKAEAQVIEAKAEAAEREGMVEATIMEKKAVVEAKAIELKAEAAKKQGLAKAEVIAKQGLAEAQVIEQKAISEAKGLQEKGLAEAQVIEKQGLAEAQVIEQKAISEAKGLEQKGLAEAIAYEKQALAEAKGMQEKGLADAKSIELKAEAMKKLNGVGREHEEFKLRLEKDKEIALAQINIQKHVSEAQAKVIAEALKSTKIDIVGGETMFYDNIINSVMRGKSIDRMVDNSNSLTDLKQNLLGGDGNAIGKVREFIAQFGLDTNDVKNLTLSSALLKFSQLTQDAGTKNTLQQMLESVKNTDLATKTLESLGL